MDKTGLGYLELSDLACENCAGSRKKTEGVILSCSKYDLRWKRNFGGIKRLMSGGPLITKEDMADANSRFLIAPSSQTFSSMSCSNNQFTDCSNVKLGNAAKAAKSRIISRLILTKTDFNRRLVGLMVQWHQYIGRYTGMEQIG
ncbi:hypothetical protein [Paenibacillus sp. CR_12]|uniref:hypothetical protein n=1 Tax=Paenibacillus sp. CR_12 TaxID=3055793 RepID=UPI0035BF05E0